ncbi:hypothetical protein KB20921_02240 [Edwardsiella ictaluri]|uniref:Uncharacterized protein n=1 Tax=Edwardsiella ictaluri (strain 93-146) TaxID=634503 RepID=C5BCE3_EDWI9|nr:hypothetical protein NT01EI_0263 [Edwardsiella ictaluri 93-146]BEH97497.1 hypothetical protein KH20906_02250 [Edwardsiella ictaluri]BEI00963.1 hypothetical protein KB20921_02240 [Edwardsiella ictaluri]BEI04439.1 hypothetical protein KH201010_02250 [Edwardsiella ictaluri]BEI07893.1 hypothetical protein STU22726_02240 [Edwardsiella ictaluri]
MLQREGWHDNRTWIYRLYCEQGLSLRLNGHATINQPSGGSCSLMACLQTRFGAWILSLIRGLTVTAAPIDDFDLYTRE